MSETHHRHHHHVHPHEAPEPAKEAGAEACCDSDKGHVAENESCEGPTTDCSSTDTCCH